MNNFTKLFLYAFATGMEQLHDSQGALRRIDDILKTPDETLWQDLKDSIEQAKRIKILKDAGVDLSHDQIGSDMDMSDLPESLLKDVLGASVSLNDLKVSVQRLINHRNNLKP